MKCIALFQIAVLVLATFNVILIVPSVNAQLPSVTQNTQNLGTGTPASERVCCEKTVSGDFCQYTNPESCDPQFRKASTSCEQTSFCKLGCGYDSLEGRCFKNTPRAGCEKRGNCTWVEGITCDIPQCDRGCCVLGSECSFTTQATCKRETSLLQFVNMTFKEDIRSELECVNFCRSEERGACVFPDSTCKFATRTECNSLVGEQGQNRTERVIGVNPNTGFHVNMLCSSDKLGTECARQQRTACVSGKDEVYWFDSCGNQENIYDSNKERSFNNGYTLSKENSCKLNGPGDADCGNCDFIEGNLCGEADKNTKPRFGDFACKDLTCNVINETEFPPLSGSKKLGESWCAYDGKVGFGLDTVGSRHFRRLCINGQELTEPCKDFREEVCMQGVQGEPPRELKEATNVQGDFVEAACRPNRFQECSNITSPENCEEIQSRDCIWIPAGVTNPLGTCVPFVPPGLKFWDGESEFAPERDAGDVCSKGSETCKVSFIRGGGSRWLGIGKGWECKENCNCLEDEWVTAVSAVCRALGDCGIKTNFLKVKGRGGFTEDAPGEDTGGNLISILNDGEDRYTFGALFKRLLIPGAVFGLSAGIAFFSTGGSVGAALGPISGTLLSGIGKGTLAGAGARAWGSLVPYSEAGITEAAIATQQKAMVEALGPGVTKADAITALAQKEGLATTVQNGEIMVNVPGAMSTVLQTLNTLAWIYTIYQVVDYLGKEDKTEEYKAQCEYWQPPLGGSDCEKCGKDEKPCSEYRCKSLGALCELVNQGTTEELCVNKHPNDVTSPVIQADKNAIKPNVTITDEISKGYKINEKIPPFTPCKFALNTSTKFQEMVHNFGSALFKYNHTITFQLPGELAEEQALRLTNGGTFKLFVRCADAAGNANNKDYYIQFSILPGPDLTPPVVELTSIDNNGFIPNNVTDTSLNVYVNEPSQCKWSKDDKEFNLMENEFTCSSSGFDVRSIYHGLYECNTMLTGLQNRKDNVFFFRCKDQPGKPDEKRNINTDSFRFTLRGTQQLKISSIGPIGTIHDLSPSIKASTEGGAEKGKAVCGFSEANIEFSDMIEFAKTNASFHEQQFMNITSGDYEYFVKCMDVAGNLAEDSVKFKAEVDAVPPKLTQIYTQGSILHIETDEDTTCEVSNTGSFDFGKGNPMTGINTAEHEARLDSNFFYIACRDKFNNELNARVYIR
ncbi:hypothetical protein HYT58_02245 [Candidatus Woesearchaeota archaeon]|nr:hypothetical protein [Candidatus Woesearchaeota archaeon]